MERAERLGCLLTEQTDILPISTILWPRAGTDESRLYTGSEDHFEAHKTVLHSGKEYARRDFEADPDATQWQENVHTNSAEGYFSIFNRGMRGIYQHCGEKHLHRYLAEYDFRYNHRVKLGFNDTDRAAIAVKQASGTSTSSHGRGCNTVSMTSFPQKNAATPTSTMAMRDQCIASK